MRQNKLFLPSSRTIGIVLSVAALSVGILGHLVETQMRPSVFEFFKDIWANISTELVSLALTVLLIDSLNQLRLTQKEKEGLILQMGSPNNALAVEAVRLLKARGYGWEGDTSLEGASLACGNLKDADLNGINLRASNLSKACFQRALLNGAFLENSCCIDTNFRKAQLNAARLSRANLTASDLHQAQLSEAVLQEARLTRVDLRETDLSAADLQDAELIMAKMQSAQLGRAYMKRANLELMDATNANLVGADLCEANLAGAILTGANLCLTNLESAFLEDAELDGVALAGANLFKATSLFESQLTKVHSLRGATMPDGKLYDGRYNLEGDICQAVECEIDISRSEEMARFYGVSIEAYNAGRRTAKGTTVNV